MPLAAEQVDPLLALPLFAAVDDELLGGVRVEAEIADGNYEWEEGATPRDGFVCFRELSDGDVLATQGELTTQFVVVLRGAVQCVQGRAGADPYHHCDLRAGDWFGEISTLSDSPALASYLAVGDALVATLDARLFKRLYAEDDTFRERIDAGYLANLGLHLRLSPLCKDLDDQALAQLEADAELLSYEDGEVIFEQGAPCDEVFLVRTGGVACFVERDGGERTLAFYKGNATFGEHAVPLWRVDAPAVAACDGCVVELGQERERLRTRARDLSHSLAKARIERQITRPVAGFGASRRGRAAVVATRDDLIKPKRKHPFVRIANDDEAHHVAAVGARSIPRHQGRSRIGHEFV